MLSIATRPLSKGWSGGFKTEEETKMNRQKVETGTDRVLTWLVARPRTASVLGVVGIVLFVAGVVVGARIW